MRGRLLILLAALVVSLVSVSTAEAITYGEKDGNGHPYVGLVVFYDKQGRPTHRCSGTLLSPKVFLTAGHCTSGAALAQVWFDSYVKSVPEGGGYPFRGGVFGTPRTHPTYGASFPNTSDLGVVILNKAVNTNQYGQLPELGVLDALATRRGQQDQTFTVVGYGLQEVKPDLQADRERYKATSKLVNLRSALTDGYNLHTSNNPGIGGGTCFGDSGGPVFLGNSNTVVGVTSFGLNQNCKGADFAYRTDIANAQNFILGFLNGSAVTAQPTQPTVSTQPGETTQPNEPEPSGETTQPSIAEQPETTQPAETEQRGQPPETPQPAETSTQ